MKEVDSRRLKNWALQLVSQGVLEQEGDRYPILKLNESSWEVMRGERKVALYESVGESDVKRSRGKGVSWEGVDRGLFEELRLVRKMWAERQEVPPYVIFSDAVLREIARVRPSTLARLRMVRGIGDAKLHQWGEQVLEIVIDYAEEKGVALDCPPSSPAAAGHSPGARPNPAKDRALECLSRGESIEEVAKKVNRAQSTIWTYLADWIGGESLESLAPWIDDRTVQAVTEVIERIGGEPLKPFFDELDGAVPYDHIRVVKAWMEARAQR